MPTLECYDVKKKRKKMMKNSSSSDYAIEYFFDSDSEKKEEEDETLLLLLRLHQSHGLCITMMMDIFVDAVRWNESRTQQLL